MLFPGSPAINAVTDAANCRLASNDQRGLARPLPFCDSGAYEFEGLSRPSQQGVLAPAPSASA